MDNAPLLITFGAAVITALVSVVVFLYKQLDQERIGRLADAKEVNKKLTSPIAELTDITKKMYADLDKKKRGN